MMQVPMTLLVPVVLAVLLSPLSGVRGHNHHDDQPRSSRNLNTLLDTSSDRHTSSSSSTSSTASSSVPSSSPHTGSSSHLTALRFPESMSTENYAAFLPDLNETSSGMTVCGWLKKHVNPTGYGVSGLSAWLNYGVMGKTAADSSEILLMDGMREVFLFGSSGGYSGLPATLNSWQHNCLVWSGPETKTLQAYVDGDLKIDLPYYTLKSDRLLQPGGALILGQYRQSRGTMKRGMSFSGDMYQVNMFRRSLSGDEVSSIYQQGVCGHISANLRESVLLPWSDFLGADRFGAVHEVKVDCSHWNTLQSFIGMEITQSFIDFLKKHHDD